MRKGEIACNKQFLLLSQRFLPYMVLIFNFKWTLKCRLKCQVMGLKNIFSRALIRLCLPGILVHIGVLIPFQKKMCFLRICSHESFLLLPRRFLSLQRIFQHFHQISNIMKMAKSCQRWFKTQWEKEKL